MTPTEESHVSGTLESTQAMDQAQMLVSQEVEGAQQQPLQTMDDDMALLSEFFNQPLDLGNQLFQ